MPAGFPLPDGGFWQYREPDAVVIVQDGFLRVAAVPYTRGHDKIQFLDNAKHMYFSTRTFACPDGGTIAFSIDLAATIIDGAPGDLYDGFVSFNVLDFSTGAALDFFVGNETIATVYGKLPFPGVPIVDPAHGPRHFCLFEEIRDATAAGQLHHFEIAYDSAADRVTLLGRRQADPPVFERPVQARAVHARARPDERKRYRARQGQRLMPRPGRGRQMGQHPNRHDRARCAELTIDSALMLRGV